jgi:prephenate dehydrogenase
MRSIVADGDRDQLLARLSMAREARSNLPGRIKTPSELAEVRIPIPDRPGAAAEVFTLAAEIGVNIANFEVVHSTEGDRGVLVIVVESAQRDLFRGGLLARGYRPTVSSLA